MAKTPAVPDEIAIAHDLIMGEIGRLEGVLAGDMSNEAAHERGRIDGLNTAMSLLFRAMVETNRAETPAAARLAGRGTS